MGLILNIETTTKSCSVAIGKDGELLTVVEQVSENYSHSEQLNLFIEKALIEVGFKFSDLDAIAVSKGPGSYTGLRIGVSTAKGLCYGLDIPLLAIDTLEALSKQIKDDGINIPLIDARRMEVYCAPFDIDGDKMADTIAKVIDENSFVEYLEKGKVNFFGDGAEKCKSTIKHPNANFIDGIFASAKGMIQLSQDCLNKKQFMDVAYFEPFYLKSFVAGKPKKLL